MPDDNVPPLNENPDHAGLTDEQMEAFLQSRFGDGANEAGEGGDADDASGTPPSGTAPSSAATDTEDDDTWEFDLDGTPTKITREQARAYAEFEQFLAANPELAEAIGGSIAGTHRFMPVETPDASTTSKDNPAGSSPATLEPPAELNLDDPVQRAVWERLKSTTEQLQSATDIIQRHESQLREQQMQTTNALVEKATSLWRDSNKDITDEDMAEIKQVVARLGVMQSLMAPVDPITGLPRSVDPIKALEDGFELARWQIPRLRDNQLAAFQQEARNNNSRKKKLSSLGGSSGSVPRQPEKVPDNPQERRQAMIAEMANMLNGNWIQPEDK